MGKRKTGKYIWQQDPRILTFDGEFVDGPYEQNCVITYKNGDKFEGRVIGQELKKGKYTYANGDYYIGEFVNGLREGQGQYYFAKDKITYEGSFRNNLRNGKG
jgi:hypothetical protein